MKVEGAGSVKGPKVEAPRSQEPFKLGPADGTSTAKALKGAHKESVELSERAELADKLMEAARAAPDVRRDLVARLKREIESGTYHRPTESIVEKLLQEESEILKRTG